MKNKSYLCFTNEIMKNKFFLLIAILTFFLLEAFAQKESNIWYFGNKAGIDFNFDPPMSLLIGQMSTKEGCASMADVNGNLLFYTDGNKVWNRNHQIMANGSDLRGHSSSTQSAIVLKKPESEFIYVVFTVTAFGGANGLQYSEVDMRLANGLGAVNSVKNVSVLAPTSEKVTAISHSNGKDFWIVTQPFGSGSGNFHSYLLTKNGLDFIPVISNIGVKVSEVVGYLKGSRNGDKIVSANTYDDVVELYDFDNATGKLSNLINISGIKIYGVEFSPNGKYLYLSEALGENSKLFQFDISSGESATVNSSKFVITKETNSLGALQIASDDKIYVARSGRSQLGVIENPDFQTNNCNYNPTGFNIGRTSELGLPTFFNSIFVPKSNILAKNTCFGDETFLSLKSNIKFNKVYWNFGDSKSANNESNDSLAKHIFSDTGWFHISAVISLNELADTVKDSVYIQYIPRLNLGNDTTLCEGDTLQLKPNIPNANYVWNNGSTESSFEIVFPGQYWVKYAVNECFDYDTINVNHALKPKVNLGMDTTLCENDILELIVDLENVNCEWQDGDTKQNYTINKSGIYAVKVWDEYCITFDTIGVLFLKYPLINLGSDTSICENETLLLTAKSDDATAYLWNDYSTNPGYITSSKGKYFVAVANNHCVSYDTIQIDHYPLPAISLGEDKVMCQGDAIQLGLDPKDYQITWFNGVQDPKITVYDSGFYWCTAFTEYCSASDTIYVGLEFLPTITIVGDSILCINEQNLLEVNSSEENYVWQNSSDGKTFLVSEPGLYTVTASNFCGTQSDSIWIVTKDCNCYVDIANAFTPNFDTKNPDFGPLVVSCEFQLYQFVIYNRWGEKIFISSNPIKKWDGSYKQNPAPTGMYLYTFESVDQFGIRAFKKGYVYLLK